jgi:nitrite reductase/ring-hydroxylating ferredoxin subunit
VRQFPDHQGRVGLVHAISQAGATALFTGSLLARAAGRHRKGRLLSAGGLLAAVAGRTCAPSRNWQRGGRSGHVLTDRCAHLGGPLHRGRVASVAGVARVTCPWHGSTFTLSDGAVLCGPSTARRPAFETRITGAGLIQVRPAKPELRAADG